MKIVLDANIIIAALLGSRGKITIITSQNHMFYAPLKIVDEIKKHKSTLCDRASFSSEEFDLHFEALLYFIEVLEYLRYEKYMKSALDVIEHRDSKDADYIACALSVNADFIWSDDKDFTDQEVVKIKTTNTFIEEGKQ